MAASSQQLRSACRLGWIYLLNSNVTKTSRSTRLFNICRSYKSSCFSVSFSSSCLTRKCKEVENIQSEKKSDILCQVAVKLLLSFTCKICNSKVTKLISKQAYTKGIVIVDCENCSYKHLIADNLGWFPNANGLRNIEEIMAAKGETVRKNVGDGCCEINEC